VSASTRLVAAFTPDVAVEEALDVGTGSGALALRMARRARRVVATDVSARALEFTRRNAEINGLGNVETHHGSFLEPVRGERFGLVACNPPYVISPDREFLYRDAGLRGDELCRRLLDELPDALADDGYATLQGNWTHPAGGPWTPATRATALLTRVKTYDPLEYAQSWCAPAHAGEPDGFAAAVERWTASYRALGIEAITLAIVVLRGGPPLRPWATTLRDRPQGLAGRLPALFAAAETLSRADVLDLRLAPAPALTIARRRTLGGEEQCTLVHPATPCVRRGVSPAVADAVAALPGPPDFTLWDELSALVKLGFVELA
jgi:SAM-dependent methyltransferase